MLREQTERQEQRALRELTVLREPLEQLVLREQTERQVRQEQRALRELTVPPEQQCPRAERPAG